MIYYQHLFPVLAILPNAPLGKPSKARTHLSKPERALDALAYLCVAQPGDAFALTMSQSMPRKLLVTSNRATVPDTAVLQIKKNWKFLYDRASGDSTFMTDQYATSWPVFQSQIAISARTVSALEDVVTNGAQFSPEQRVYATALKGVDRQITVQTLRRIIDRLRSLDWVTSTMSPTSDQITRVHELIGLFKPELTPGTKDLLIDIGAAVDVPIRTDIQNILRLDASIMALIYFGKSEKVVDFVTTQDIEVQAVPPRMGHYDFKPDDKDAKFLIGEAFLGPSDITPPPEFLDDYQADLLPKLTSLHDEMSQAHDQTNDGFSIPIHPECTLLAVVYESSGDAYVPYIGTSEKSCLLCYRFISACATCNRGSPKVNGSNGQVTFPWAKPDLTIGDSQRNPEARFGLDVIDDATRTISKYASHFLLTHEVKPRVFEMF